MTTLCLNMIVRDESAIIERALRAAAPHLACYVIADTGSTDDTVAKIERVMAEYDVPGTVVHTSFENFEQARNEALEAARTSEFAFDYLLLCDADMELVVDPGGFDGDLTADVYNLMQFNPTSSMGYQNARLVRRDAAAKYVGVTHEYLDGGPLPRPLLTGARFIDHAAGSSRSVKYQRDIDLLSAGLRADPDNRRYRFYLAQSYRDAGENLRAYRSYQLRVEMGGWEEEVWYSLLQLAFLAERIGRDYDAVVAHYLRAHQYRPRRAEAMVELARYHRGREEWPLAYLFARQAAETPRPDDILFIDESAYAWRARDEYAVACYWTGRYDESLRACELLLEADVLPGAQRDRIEDNRRHSLRKLAE